MPCDFCNREMSVAGFRHDDRHGYPGFFELLRCASCGHCRLATAMSTDQITALYTNFYPRRHFDVNAWTPHAAVSGLRAWWRGARASAFRWVPRNVRVLDIGCGFGESLGYHRDRGCNAYGVEADANVLRVAERYGLEVRHGLFDATHYEPASFDVVTLDQVAEHLSDPTQVLRGIHRVLVDSGLLVLSTPNVDGWGARVFGRRWIHWHAPYHLQFFSTRSMAKAAAAAGFRIDRTCTVTASAWLHFQWGHLLTYPQPGEPSAYWTPGRPRSLPQRIGLKIAHWFDRAGLNAILTRLFDALGLGDNRVYLLRKVEL